MGKFFENLVRPVLFRLSPESAHDLGIAALRTALGTKAMRALVAGRCAADPGFGTIERFGLRFRSPLGIAAGFDKNGVAVDQLAALGFGFVEVGTVTLRAQSGNEKPRLFRLPADQGLINRLGFNNDGVEAVAERLLRRERGPVVVGVNIGKNRDVPIDAAIGNYVDCFKAAFNAADYIAVNVSSPNTPNLRELQRAENLEDLLRELRDANLGLAAERGVPPRPLLVKIAPDLEDPEVETIVGTAVNLGLAGLIATNTTVSREGLRTALNEAGGLSGKPLRKRSDAVVRLAYRTARGRLPIIGVGGIFSASDAFEKIAAGASLVQAYTGFVYGGPMFARDINAGLARILFERGFASLDDAVGSAAPNGRNV